MPTTLIRNADMVVAWDAGAKSHVYMPGADVAFEGGVLRFVGRGYDGHGGRGDLRRRHDGDAGAGQHPLASVERADEQGADRRDRQPGFYNSSLYEYLPIFRADAEAMPHCVRVALSELLLSGVTTLADLSMAHPGWLDLLAEAGMRVCIAPMFRSGRWYTKNGHMVEYAWDEAAGEKAMAEALSLIERAEQHPSGRLFGMVVPAQIDTCTEGLLRRTVRRGEARAACRGRSTRRSRSASSTRSPAGTATRRSAGWTIWGCCRSARSSATASSSTTIRRRAGTPIPT